MILSGGPSAAPSVRILGSRVDLLPRAEVLGRVGNWIGARDGRCRRIVVTGFHGLWEATRDPELWRVLNSADLWVPDGIAPVWIARMRGHRAVQRLPGAELMAAVFEQGRPRGYRHFLYGDTPQVLERLQRAIETRWPGNTVVGAISPPFRPISASELDVDVARINAARPDVLWVALGMAKQDRWIHAVQDRLEVPVAAGVGAAFGFLAGTVRRAPAWVGRAGLEWAYRLLREPRKCWRRSLLDGPRFAAAVLAEERRRTATAAVAQRPTGARTELVRHSAGTTQSHPHPGHPRLAVVVPTKDRPGELRLMLRSLEAQHCPLEQVIVVDSSTQDDPGLVREFPRLPLEHVRYAAPPSAAAQRNAGVRRVRAGVELVGLIDDDQVLLPGSLEAMLSFWRRAPACTAGAGFNLLNEVDRRPALVKRSRWVERLGLYARAPGVVARSGWQTLTGVAREDMDVEWLGSGAAVWRREVFDRHAFDEHFDRYSYLEDLDFSYTLSRRRRRLAVVAAAGVQHHRSQRGRVSWVDFGRVEVRNRLYFVRKHRLSVARCQAALLIRAGMTTILGVCMPWRGGLARAWGNALGMVQAVRSMNERPSGRRS